MSVRGVPLGVLRALGPRNVLRVGVYRMALRTRLHPVQRLRAESPSGPFFRPAERFVPRACPRSSWDDRLRLFGRDQGVIGEAAPDWHRDPLTGIPRDPDRPWWEIPDFCPDQGDVKAVWELSRFDWVLAFSQRAAGGDDAALRRLENWLSDWVSANPPYHGVNWKCGQEASIRVLHLAAAALVLQQIDDASPALLELVALHLRRIAPTLAYALGQQNNHGTSEAAALFVGGAWLMRDGKPEGQRWCRLGRRWLEERARRLVEPDGTFSQYSVTYHRMMLDTYAFAELWRRRLALRPFSPTLHDRLGAATHWLRQLVDPATGDAPNLGTNDGTSVLCFSDHDYRDFRPSLQGAATLFLDARALEASGDDERSTRWRGLTGPYAVLSPPESRTFDQGGLHVLRAPEVALYLRYPRYRFRPAQADALHVDLWIRGRNLLRDGGSYSYAADPSVQAAFAGTAGHNTIQFDGRDQMPRIGRFLFGAWLRARDVAPVSREGAVQTAAAGYADRWGATHHREVRLSPGGVQCVDTIGGNATLATLRWRLDPERRWSWDGEWLDGGDVRIRVRSDRTPSRREVVRGWESRYYLECTELPVLEVELPVPARIDTELRF